MRVLIIEDEIKIANAIKKGLEQEGYAVDTANDGLAGYDLAATEPYDIIILDLMLPGLDGIMICKKLRKKGIYTNILMLTAKGNVEDKVTGLDCGADDYLTKPFNFEELLARVRALLRRKANETTNELKCGNLTINIQTYETKRDGIKIDLSRTEFSLLEYLIHNKNKIVSKDSIIEHVWNYDANVLPNTVEVYIGYLRNKIDKPFKNEPPLINTVRGFGYILKCLNQQE